MTSASSILGGMDSWGPEAQPPPGFAGHGSGYHSWERERFRGLGVAGLGCWCWLRAATRALQVRKLEVDPRSQTR